MAIRYKNSSELRQVVVIGGMKTQLMPGDVFESDRELKIAFLEKVPDNTPTTVKPGKRFSSVVNLQQKVMSLETQRQQIAEASSGEVQKLTEENTRLKEEVSDLKSRQDALEEETRRKLEMMKTAMMMLQEDFYGVEFDENGRQIEKDATFPGK
jgi:hypothetical protein